MHQNQNLPCVQHIYLHLEQSGVRNYFLKMAFKVHFANKCGLPSFESAVFARFNEAQHFAMQRQRELRADLVAIREVETDHVGISVAKSIQRVPGR